MFPRLLDFRRVEARNLNQNPIVTDGADDRLANAEVIDALSDHFDRLVEHSLVHFFVATHQANQERRAALDIEAELDLVSWRPDCGDAERHQQHDQCRGEQSLS